MRGGCWFEGPSLRLHLGVEDDFRPATKAHPALLVDDLDVVCQHIVAAGGEVRPADDQPGHPPRSTPTTRSATASS